MVTTVEAYNLLVIEDDPSEQKLIRMMVKISGYPFTIKFLNDGEEAVNFIKSFPDKEELFGKVHLIFLDLNLPKVNGIEVLKTIRQNDILKKTPVVVLTTSNSKSDINLAYEAGASGFVRKPSLVDEYEKAIRKVFDYWFGTCLTP
jgi:CheY-like chemotaxis protein